MMIESVTPTMPTKIKATPLSRPHQSEHQRSTLRLLIATQLKVLTPLQRQLRLCLAHRTFQPQHNLLRRLGLLVEHWLCLTSVPRLLAVVTALSLGEERGFAGLVLGDCVYR